MFRWLASAFLAAAALAGAAAGAAEVPDMLLTLEVTAPMRAGFEPSALPPRFVLFEDGQVFVGGTSEMAAGRLDKAEVRALERRLDALRKRPGLGGPIVLGSGASPRFRLQAPRKKVDVVVTGDPAAAPSALRPLAAFLGELSSFHHPSLRPYEPATLALTVREAPLPGGCRGWTLPVPLAEALAGPRAVAASEAHEWPRGAVPATVCDGDRRFVVTLRPLLPGERPGPTPP